MKSKTFHEDLRWSSAIAAMQAGSVAPNKQAASRAVQPTDSEVPAGMGGWLTNGAAIHPHTLNLVVRFSRALAAKLAAAEVKYGYSDGWRSADWMDECRAKLMEHVAKGDPRDVAAYCAFLWHHGESTAAAAPVPEAPVAASAAEELLTEIRRALNASGVWHLGMDTVEVIKMLAAAYTPAMAPVAQAEAVRRFCNKCGYFGSDMIHQRPNGTGECSYLAPLAKPPAQAGTEGS